MADHLLEECEFKGEYMRHSTGLAVKKTEMEEYDNLDKCPEGTMYCPLCKKQVADTDEEWRKHLFYMCPKNTRSHDTRK